MLPPLTWEERRRGRRRGRPFVESAMKLEAVRGGGAERRQAVRALRRFDLCFLCSELGLPLHVFTTAYPLRPQPLGAHRIIPFLWCLAVKP